MIVWVVLDFAFALGNFACVGWDIASHSPGLAVINTVAAVICFAAGLFVLHLRRQEI